MLRTPREKFVASAHCAEFKDLVQKESFEEALVAALAELQSQMPYSCSPNVAADSHNQMTGARRYVEILSLIWQPEQPAKVAPKRGLDYAAGV